MARNRKTQSVAIRLVPAIKICLFCLFIAGSAIGYVGQKTQLQALAGQYRDLEIQLGKLRRDNAARSRVLDTLQTPSELETRIKQLNMGMVAPQPAQIVRLAERPVPASSQETNRLYAHQSFQLNAQP